MPLIKTILFSLGCMLFINIQAQSVVFNNVYNDYSRISSDSINNLYFNNYEAFGQVLVRKNGHFLMSGASYDYPNSIDSFLCYMYLVETNTYGDTLKQLNLDLGAYTQESVYDVIEMNDSSLFLFGYTSNSYYDGINPKGVIVKLDKELNLIWHKTDYGIGNIHRMNRALFSEIENVFYVLSYAGVDTNDFYVNIDIFISKIDTAGNILNTWQYGGLDWDLCFDFEMLGNGTFILSGYTYNNTSGTLGNPDLYILKVDTFGNMLWDKRYGFIGNDYTEGRKNLYVDQDAIFMVGKYEKMNGDDIGWLLKMTLQGDTLWTKMYEHSLDYDDFRGIERWDNNSFILLGATKDTNIVSTSKPQAWLIKIDTLGNKIWERTISAYPNIVNAQTYVYDYEFAPDRGVLLTGYVINNYFQENGIYHRNDAWLAKTDSCGYTVGDIPEPLFVVDSIIQNKESNTVYITEKSTNYCSAALNWGDGSIEKSYYAYENNLPLAEKHFEHSYTQNGTYTIKTTTLAGEEYRSYEINIDIVAVGINAVIPAQAGISLFPNPASDYVIVQNVNSTVIAANTTVIPLQKGISMNIFNLNGKQVKRIALNHKLYQQKIDVSALNNGVYFVRFMFGDLLLGTEKLVIAR